MEKRSLINDFVAEEIRALLARRRMSASDLARKTGMTQRAISRRLTGEKVIDVDDLHLIAQALDVELVALLPRANEGRLITTAGSPNHGYAPAAERPRRAPKRMSAKRRATHTHPVGRPETSSATSTSAGPPTQRRATLVAHRPGN